MNSVIAHVADITRGALRPEESTLFALQCVAWAKQAERGRVAGPTTDPRMLLKKRFQEAWADIRDFEDAGLAFDRRFEFFEHLSEDQLQAVVGTVNSRDSLHDVSLIEAALSLAYPAHIWAPDAQLCELLVALCQIERGEHIYCPFDDTLQLSVASARAGARVTTRIQSPSPLPWLINLILGTEISIQVGSPFGSTGQGGNKYDKTVALLPAGRLPNTRELGFTSSANTLDTAGLEHALKSTASKVVVAAAPRLAFGTGKEQELRKHLVNSRSVEAVIALPTGMVYGTGLALRVFVLDLNGGRSFVRMIDATEASHIMVDMGKRARLADPRKLADAALGSQTNTARAVPVSEIEAAEFSFEPRRFMERDDWDILNPLLTSSNRVKLGDIVEFVRPLPTKRTPGHIEIFEISASDIPKFGYLQRPGKSTEVDLSVTGESPFVRPLDLVLITKGSVGKVCIVPQDVPEPGRGGWAVGQSGIILRVKNRSVIDPHVLVSYLRSAIGQSLLTAEVSTSTTRMLQLARLKALPVVLPPQELAVRITANWGEQARIEEEISRLRRRQNALQDQVWTAEPAE